MSRMKYVIFKDGNLLKPFIFPESTAHSELKMTGRDGNFLKPVSAGFVYFTGTGILSLHVGHEHSESLKLGPHPKDEHYLTSTVLGCGTSSFIDYDNEYKT